MSIPAPPEPDAPTPTRDPLPWLPAPNPYSVVVAVLVLSLLFAPLIRFPFDVESCWLPWSRASLGYLPWRIYLTRPDCNYPPLVLYLLTVQEAMRRALHADETGVISLVLTKLPNLVAHLAGALAGYFLLRKPYGELYARRFTLLYATSLSLFVNAALWGQADALLALPMLLSVLFLMRDRPVHAGVALGIALTVKLQAVVIAPVLLLYAFRRFGAAALLRAAVAGLLVMAVVALPFVLAGATAPMLKAYTGANGYYPLRSLNTFNLWGGVNYVDQYVRHLPSDTLNQDDRPALGALTFRHVGILLFLAALAALMVTLWRRPTATLLAWTAGLSALAFVTLCTQMHERYWVPGAALLLIVAPESLPALGLVLLVGANSAWNQWLVLLSNFSQYNPLPPWCKWSLDAGWGPSCKYLPPVNVILLAAALVGTALAAQTRQKPPFDGLE